jgi:hypothetical protein
MAAVSQSLNSPATVTFSAFGAQTAKRTPLTPSIPRPGARPACDARLRAACLRCAGRGRNRRAAARSGRGLRSRFRGRRAGARGSDTAAGRRPGGAEETIGCFLLHRPRRSSPASTSADSACGRNARTSQRAARLFANAVRPQDAKGVAVVSAHDGFNFFNGHESLICEQVWTISAQLPKAELHLHLEGSVEPKRCTNSTQPRRRRIRALYRYADFDAFLKAFGAVGKRLRTPGRLCADHAPPARAAGRAERALRRDHRGGRRGAVERAGIRADFRRHPRCRARLARGSALDSGRGPPVRRRARLGSGELAAATRQDRGVVAFGIGGSETRGPAEWFTDVFAFAKSAGLHLTAHAGRERRTRIRLGGARIGRRTDRPRHRRRAR